MKKKQTILAGAAVLLVLAAAFWYGGDAPGLRGWSLSQDSAQSAASSSQASPAAPSGAASSAEPEGDNPSSDGAAAEGSTSGGGETSAEIQQPAGTEEPSTGPAGPAQPAGDSGDASGQPEEPAQSTPPQPAQSSGEGESAACRISIDCSTVLSHLDWLESGKEDILPAGGVLLAETAVEPEAGETAFSLLQRVTREQGIHLEASFTPGTGSAYVEGIGNLYEFDCGQRSGWLYLVNGVSPGYSSSEYVLEPGDRVEWVYTCDMGRDVGAAAVGG